MKISSINPEETIFSLDIGTRSIIGTVGVVREKKFHVICEEYTEHQERAMIDGQIHDINLVANGVSVVKRSLEKKLNFKLKNVSIAAAGRFLRTTTVKSDMEIDDNAEIDKETIRSLELTAVKLAEDEVNKQSEGRLYCVGYSVTNYYLNGYVISNLLSHKGENIAVEVIATFLPRSVVDSLYSVMDKVGLNVINLTLEPIAAMEAAIPQSLRLLNLALVDIGAGTSDIAISSKDSISAYGMVPLAGDEVTEAIAQNILVDFNTAEKIKREVTKDVPCTYTDVMGFENQITYDEIIKIISPVIDKIANETGKKIIELNGGKAPNAVFLVGGGAHTPGLKDAITEVLKLSPQRIAIKGRDAVTECVCMDNTLGSTGVTVLGIALVSIKRLGHDFIDVYLNGNVVSLFNSHRHTVMDVLIQAGISPKVLMGRNGKNIRFMLNDIKRVAFGSLASNAKIKINGRESNMDAEVKESDNIEIEFARDGNGAVPKVADYIQKLYSVSFYMDNKLVNLEPVITINDEISSIDKEINEGDNVKIVYPETLGDYKKYLKNKSEYDTSYYIGNVCLNDNYKIKDGDRINRISSQDQYIVDSEIASEEKNNCSEKKNISDSSINIVKEEEKVNKIEILVNDKKVILSSSKKNKFIFIDIFDFIDFDLTIAKGSLVLMLNDQKAGYYDALKQGDNVKIYWE